MNPIPGPVLGIAIVRCAPRYRLGLYTQEDNLITGHPVTKPPLNRQRVVDAVNKVRKQYLLDECAPSLYEINNGLCEDFATDVVDCLNWVSSPADSGGNWMIVENGNFQRNSKESDTRWDTKLLSEFWQIAAPAGFTWHRLNAIDYGNHIWLAAKVGPNGTWLHFDAECDQGVASFFELPLFARYIRNRWPTKAEVLALPADAVWFSGTNPPQN